VQGALDEAAARISGHPVRVRGASRTDAGVHALGQVVAFDTERELSAVRWALALNRYLPEDLAVVEAHACAAGYEPRFDAVDKRYRYLLQQSAMRNPLTRSRAWHVGKLLRRDRDSHGKPLQTLDFSAMQAAASQLVGTHDFRAFKAADDERPSSVRTLSALDVLPAYQGDTELCAIEVVGTAFLKNMVRILAGTLVEVGRGRMRVEQVAALVGPLAQRSGAGSTAPAHGLTLVQVRLGRTRAAASQTDR
jgi:tRNA pseudouridine38-40 synthase